VTRSGRAFATALTARAFWIGMALSQTGPYAAPGQNHLRGRQLCAKPEKIPDCARGLAGTSRP